MKSERNERFFCFFFSQEERKKEEEKGKKWKRKGKRGKERIFGNLMGFRELKGDYWILDFEFKGPFEREKQNKN